MQLQLEEKKELEEQLKDLRKKLKESSQSSLDKETLKDLFTKV